MADIGHSHGTGRTPPAPHQVRQAVAAIIVPMIVATVAGLIIFWPRQAGPALTDDDLAVTAPPRSRRGSWRCRIAHRERPVSAS